MKIALSILSFLLVVSGIIVASIFFLHLSHEYTYGGGGKILVDKTGEVGDFIGGVVGTIFSLAGFIILIVTLSEQTKASYIEQFESKFFELLKIHRENVAEIEVKRSAEDEEKHLNEFHFKGRQAFKIILDDFITCRNELKQYFMKFETVEIYEPAYLKELSGQLDVPATHIRLRSIAKVNISYCIIFYGVSQIGFEILEKLFKNKYRESFYLNLLRYASMKPILNSKYWADWKRFRQIDKVVDRITTMNEIFHLRKKHSIHHRLKNQFYYDNRYIKFYGGHQHRLGHYYRHLFQTFKFINDQKQLTPGKKYFYAKTLRAQLSTYEQALLFVNSLSILGMPWELGAKYQKSDFDFINKKRQADNRLITKYNLIKNLPGEHILGINYAHYYPKVDYEIPISQIENESE
jgi:hypothetical protein